jgi:tRNA pseudouridine55 synthase
VAGVRLGVRTTTDDPEGEIEATSDAWRSLSREDVERSLDPFRGRIVQTPPRFSAKKVGGESAHYRARRGEDVALAPVEVEVLALELGVWNPPDVELRVDCSAGTYVRALARDIGDALGTGAHLTALRRTAIGSFTVGHALAIDALWEPDAVDRAWITPAAALAHLPSVHVPPEDALRLARGQTVPITEATTGATGGAVAVLSERELVAVAAREGDRLRPRKVFVGGSA